MTSQKNIFAGGYIFRGPSYRWICEGRRCTAPEMPQLKKVPFVSCFKELTCLFLSIMVEVTSPTKKWYR